MFARGSVVVVMAFVMAACNQESQQQTPATDTTTAAGTTGVQGMEGMQGMNMGGSQDMMQQMQSHMQMMEGAQGDSLRNMATMHRQMAANMLAQMNRDMQQMNMAADPNWDALVDSVRQDLTRMPEWSNAEMRAAISAHMSRMRRLMEMHGTMMKNM
jgi:hypothetical protein